ncbi:hypothetical protein C7C45_10250 [Micromonospora arborensis]|uniref:Uncharacterized protein n=1 Tax=Micromonospora arborensis TaxID=2116518 RepID=A0A318NQ73_9ACTN|nr:hypothetical protein C7C45_10250 [Micromonospora arborensis]
MVVATRSPALRSTQNSFPSGSASTAQPVPSACRWSVTRVAPRASTRSTSSSLVRSTGSRQMWSRFFVAFSSGTSWKNRFGVASSDGSRAASGSPGAFSPCGA